MMIGWRLAPAATVLGAAAFGLTISASAIELAQAPAPAPQRPAQTQPKPKPSAQKPAQSPAKPPASAAGGAQPQLLGQFGDWGAYTASPGGRKVCFALAKPAKAQTEPPNRPRDASYIFIASRPADNVRNEVSVMFGYAFKPNAEASLEIAGANFSMYTQSDGGWIKNAAEEPRLVESMRKAADMTVKGVSARGTTSADTYSLKGLAQALDRVAQECR
ncbi:MAG TPA: invasion associated locus B family protein [Rhodoplanes sp.]|nr:invasion associated locus B family protein [Rhodoplanes sp.]